MPSRCTKCGKVHPDDANYILERGCDTCGSRFFFFVKEPLLAQAEEDINELSKREISEMEKDIRDIVAKAGDEEADDETVILDVEAIRVIKPGKYRIDLTNLFTQRPIIIRVGPGRYEIDLSTIMSRFRK
jgi:predicted  nucleic acid-binding Zn-ribbon protein